MGLRAPLSARPLRGLPVAIYRPGVMSGDSRTGIGNLRDMVWSYIKAAIQLGLYPQTGRTWTSPRSTTWRAPSCTSPFSPAP